MPRHRVKTDKNHMLIKNTFKKLGFSVFDARRVGQSFPDLVIAKNEINILVEIKSEKGKLSEGQKKFQDNWQGWIETVVTVEDCIKLNELIGGRK